MQEVDYGDLSEELQNKLAALQIDVDELKFEANFYRWASLITFIILVERLWARIF